MSKRTKKTTTKSAAKSSARKTKKVSAKKATVRRTTLNENARIKVVGENTRQERGRFYKPFELMRKGGTVANFLKNCTAKVTREKPAVCLRLAQKEGFIKLSA